MESKSLRIVYMGTPDFSVMPLKRLVEAGYCVVGVVTTPDKPAGRGLKLQACAVKQYALEAGLPVLQPERLKAPEFIEAFRALQADLGIVIAFRMLPEVIWAMPRLGTFNLHASLLPQYRGAAPINWALINGESETGVTTFMLNAEIDKGDILCRARVAITPEDDAGTLHDKLMVRGTELVIETVEKLAHGGVTPIPQLEIPSDTEIHEAPKIFKENSRIDWSSSSEAIHNLVRGLSPYPGAWTEWEAPAEEILGGASAESAQPQRLKIYKTRIESARHQFPQGTIFTDGKQELRVATFDGYVVIEELQLAGKKRMTAPELLRGIQSVNRFCMR